MLDLSTETGEFEMKSPKTMVAILAVSTLGLANVAVAETQEVDGGANSEQTETERADRNRQRRRERDQSADSERQSARQQRREARQGTAGETDARDERRPTRSRTDPDSNTSQDGLPNNRRFDRRREAEGPSNHGGFDRRADRYNSNRRARFGDRRNNDNLGRRGFKRTQGDQRKETKRLLKNQRQIARMERRFERDGYYSRRERRILKNALDRASHRIKRAQNDEYSRRYARRHHGWHDGHHRYEADPYAYEDYDETYVAGRSSSTTISAQADGFSVSWSTSDQE